MKTGFKLKILRAFKNLTCKEAADKIGMGSNFLHLLEKEKVKGSIDTFRKISNFYDVTIECLINENIEIIFNIKKKVEE
jgi:DNA-binding XRE family transcriptional regulator